MTIYSHTVWDSKQAWQSEGGYRRAGCVGGRRTFKLYMSKNVQMIFVCIWKEVHVIASPSDSKFSRTQFEWFSKICSNPVPYSLTASHFLWLLLNDCDSVSSFSCLSTSEAVNSPLLIHYLLWITQTWPNYTQQHTRKKSVPVQNPS